MVPPIDDSPKSLGDGATGSDVERAEESSPGSLGEAVTGSNVESSEPVAPPQGLGDQSATGDMGSSVSDLDTLVVDLDDEQNEVVDLATRYEIQESPTADGTDDPED